MKNFALVIKSTIASLALSLIVACADKPQTQTTATESKPEPVAPAGEVITVGVDNAYPPYDFLDERGNPIGFDVEIIQAIAKHQNLNINIVPQGWGALMTDLDNAKNDLVLSGLMKTEERANKYLVSNAYVWGQDVIAVKPNNDSIHSLKDLIGKNTSTLADSAYIPQLEAVLGKKSPNIIARPTDFLAFQELTLGRVEAMLGEKYILLHYAKNYPEAPFKMVDGWIEPYEVVIMAPKSNTEIMKKVNAGIAGIVADGTYAQIYQKWFGVAPDKLPGA